MKKLILLFAAVLITTASFSQLTFGPKIGYNTAKLSLDRTDINSDLKNNFQFGIFLRIGKKIYVQPEVNWLTQGSIFQTPLNSSLSPFKQEVNLKTVQIPLIIGARLIDLKMVNFRVFGGPTASIVQEKTIDNSITNLVNPITEAHLEDMIWSFQVGAGIDVLGVTVDIRYNIGLNKVIGQTVDVGSTPTTFDSKTSGFNVSIGYKIF
ncbi:MAG: hypothetical protein CL663_04085 [Bacteroidetes bacterium]|nr:hypothetical protein [Bacteroidota bacterium]